MRSSRADGDGGGGEGRRLDGVLRGGRGLGGGWLVCIA